MLVVHSFGLLGCRIVSPTWNSNCEIDAPIAWKQYDERAPGGLWALTRSFEIRDSLITVRLRNELTDVGACLGRIRVYLLGTAGYFLCWQDLERFGVWRDSREG